MRKLQILLITILAVFLVAGTAMAYPVNVRPIAGTTAADFTTLQSDLNAIVSGFDAYNDQNGTAIFVPTGQVSGTTYEISNSYSAYSGSYEIGLYDYNTDARLTLWSSSTQDGSGNSFGMGDAVSVTWNAGGYAVVSWTAGPGDIIEIDSELGFGPEFGFFVTSVYGTFFSDDLRNDTVNRNDNAQMIAFDGNQPPGDPVNDNYWYIAMEAAENDGTYGYYDGAIDFNDFIIKMESVTPVPEPATMLLLGSGLLGLALVGRMRFIKK